MDRRASSASAGPGGSADAGAPQRRPLLGSIRVRMVALSVLLLLAALAVSVATTRFVLEQRTGERIGREMQREIEEFRALAGGIDPATGQPFGDDVERIFRVFLQRNVPSQNEVFITYLGGEPFLRSGGQPPVRLDRIPDLTERWGAVERRQRGRVEVADAGAVVYQATPITVDGQTAGVFVAAWFLDAETEEIDGVVTAAAALGGLVLLIAAGVVWLVISRVLRPVDEVAATARSISESDLSRRIDWHRPDEIGRLVATFNDMLDRLDAAFAAQREFIDDAGHELRTPVTIIRGNLDLLHYGDEAQRASALTLVNDELDRIQRMVDDLLLLAKAQRPDFLATAPVDLDALTTDVYDKAKALGDRDWRLDEVALGVLDSDRQRLTQALLQLAHNAVRHTAPGERIAIGSRLADGHARLWVADHGVGVDPDDAERIFARFSRGGHPAAHHDGAGLGLAIVDAIARAHGGRVELSPTDGGGATFTIVLPAEHTPGAPSASTLTREVV